MKLCARAIKIRDEWRVADFDGSPTQALWGKADQAAMARVLNRHLSRCRMCSK